MDETQDPTAGAAPEGAPGPGEMPEVDLAQIRVEALILQLASELMTIGAGHLGMIPGMVNGGDAVQASLAIAGADALVEGFARGLPPGVPEPPQVDELRRAVAELKLAFAEAVRGPEGEPEAGGQAPPSAGGGGETPSPQPPPAAPPRPEVPRPRIWTPGGEV